MTTKNIAILGLMLGIMIIFNALESLIQPLPFFPPNVRLGFANIIVMLCALSMGGKQAVILNVLKALFVLLARGPMAGLLSLCGGMLSVFVIILLVKRSKTSYGAISVAGACAHNTGQLAAAAFILSSPVILYYLPVLIIAGIATGMLTGAILKGLHGVIL